MPVVAASAPGRVESNCASRTVPLTERFRPRVGCADSSNSMPCEWALGTLNTMRDEQEPASSVTCRLLMSV